jgi:hypothetical protein
MINIADTNNGRSPLMTEHNHLDQAAALLMTVGRAPLGDVDTGAILHCLHAQALLSDAGAQPIPRQQARPAVSAEEARAAVRRALAELARLDPTTFARAPVLAAAHACHQALHDLA